MNDLVTIAAILMFAGALGAAEQRPALDPRSMGGGNCADNPYNCADTPNPLPATETTAM